MIYNVKFDGYFISNEDLPNYSGIYAVYVGSYNRINNNVDIRDLIYVGEAENIYGRHHNHEKQAEFEKELEYGETLIYSTAERNVYGERKTIQDAIIYKVKPKLNTDSVNSFNHPQTTLNVSGRHFCIPDNIVCR